MNCHVRWMIRRDMEQVLAIEWESFQFPWDKEHFIRALSQRNCIGMVCEDLKTQALLGFMVYELHKSRLHVLNFAVEQTSRRRGVGTEMIRKLHNKLSPERRRRILLEVRESNVDAQLFFRHLGFRAVEVLHDFYDDTDEDAYRFELRYSDTWDTEQTLAERIFD